MNNTLKDLSFKSRKFKKPSLMVISSKREVKKIDTYRHDIIQFNKNKYRCHLNNNYINFDIPLKDNWYLRYRYNIKRLINKGTNNIPLPLICL